MGNVIIFVAVAVLTVVVIGYTLALAKKPAEVAKRGGMIAGIAAVVLIILGLYLGLVWAPTERMMGDSYRIM